MTDAEDLPHSWRLSLTTRDNTSQLCSPRDNTISKKSSFYTDYLSVSEKTQDISSRILSINGRPIYNLRESTHGSNEELMP